MPSKKPLCPPENPPNPPENPSDYQLTNALYKNWLALIPTLVDPVLCYFRQTWGKALENIHPVISVCGKKQIFADIYAGLTSTDVLSCTCSTLHQVLVHHGLFLTAPSQPQMAVSINLLSFYRVLFERLCDAINALASALKNHYSWWGNIYLHSWITTNTLGFQGELIQDPFRQGLGYAIQWYDILQVEVECQVEMVIQQHRDHIAKHQASLQVPNLPSPTQCAPHLVQRPTDEGGDIHVAMDDCLSFYNPTYFLPKSFVDTIGHHIDMQCKRPMKSHVPLIPDLAKAAMDSFDDTGIMALICRHDIPLFFANIDSPGEQQKYLVALLQHFFSLLPPPKATVVALYDVGCVLARTLSKYNILSVSITSCLQFATTAMHAYGHEWACQLMYNPWICVGLGLSDGEGTEHLWSCLVRLIGVERTSSRQCHLWLIDQQAVAIASEMQIDLDTPAHLKKELDTVLALQADLDASDKALQTMRAMLEKDMVSDDTLEALKSLERGHDCLMNKVEALYSSLNVHNRFPELDGINLEFVHTLLMACDLKMNVRKCAIASFSEWDKLDQAVGSTQQVLGTKLHQQTHKAISKRQPALMSAIRKFNSYCEQLNSLYDPSWGIPLPAPLPTKLVELCSDPGLMEDVWITLSVGDIPQWLDDTSIRDGIRGLLKCDQCREEQVQLGIKADNLCHFFSNELAALELALLLLKKPSILDPAKIYM
ncbi:hypothetical protein BDR05DRAFT_978544 [Suillus weaverae]|nr:hypothetical protein BDR05DRAFT_978544 [Suillus weaverae]